MAWERLWVRAPSSPPKYLMNTCQPQIGRPVENNAGGDSERVIPPTIDDSLSPIEIIRGMTAALQSQRREPVSIMHPGVPRDIED